MKEKNKEFPIFAQRIGKIDPDKYNDYMKKIKL